MKKKPDMIKFLKIFALVFVIESVLSMVFILGQQFVDKPFSTIIAIMISILSLPVSLLDRTYPFYTPEPAVIAIPIYLLNVLVHSVIVYSIIKGRQSKSA